MSENQKDSVSIGFRYIIPLITVMGGIFAGFYQGRAQSDTNQFILNDTIKKVVVIEASQKDDHDKIITLEGDMKNVTKNQEEMKKTLNKILEKLD
jgi:hypothetical protein